MTQIIWIYALARRKTRKIIFNKILSLQKLTQKYCGQQRLPSSSSKKGYWVTLSSEVPAEYTEAKVEKRLCEPRFPHT